MANQNISSLEPAGAPDLQFVMDAMQILEQQAVLLSEGQADQAQSSKIIAQVAADIKRALSGETLAEQTLAEGSEAAMDVTVPQAMGLISSGLPYCSSCYTTYQKCVAAGGTSCLEQYKRLLSKSGESS